MAIVLNGQSGKEARHAAIRRVIRTRPVGTQEELGRLLGGEGFHVTQATLSRDLAQLGALRAPRPGAGPVYELDPSEVPLRSERLHEMGDLVLLISDNELLTVVRTQPGAANAVARSIDLARLPEVLGTIAGDDTIFVTPVRGTSARRLSHAIRSLLGKQTSEARP